MAEDRQLRLARSCFEQSSWREAWELLSACNAESALHQADLERLAVAAFLVAENGASDEAWRQALQRHLLAGDRIGAVRCAFWLVFRLLNAGEMSSATGWLARAERLVGDAPSDSAEQAYVAYLHGLAAVLGGDLPRAEAHLTRSSNVAERCGEVDLSTLARLALGRVLVFRGDVRGGVRLIDEAMVAVVAGETSPIVVGDSFCTALDACHDLVDVRRGQAWTAAFGRWCATQPDLVPYAGLCQVHRSEFLQLKGVWVEAMAQAGLARRRLSSPVGQPALGAAIYQEGELHRLRGQFDDAERCYRDASHQGRDPQPGLALLRLASGHGVAAARGVQRAVAESDAHVNRPQLLAAFVEVMLATGDVPAARSACDELAELAQGLGSPMLAAMCDQAVGATILSEGDAQAALPPLRRASSGFRSLEAAYELARTGVLIALARRALGDEEGAGLEVAATRTLFEDLGARADLKALDRAMTGQRQPRGQVLTGREVQVLRLVAQGSTNRSIGAELGLSERTVDRHVSNIFAKLGVSSRAAATASAYQADLL